MIPFISLSQVILEILHESTEEVSTDSSLIIGYSIELHQTYERKSSVFIFLSMHCKLCLSANNVLLVHIIRYYYNTNEMKH